MKFPKTLYVKIGNDGSGNEYLDPHTASDTLADAGERCRAGVYTLSQIVEATGSVTVVSTKPVNAGARKRPKR